MIRLQDFSFSQSQPQKTQIPEKLQYHYRDVDLIKQRTLAIYLTSDPFLYQTNNDFPVISLGCGSPIIARTVGATSARTPSRK